MKKILSLVTILLVLPIAVALASCEDPNAGAETSETTTHTETRDVNKDEDEGGSTVDESDTTEEVSSEETSVPDTSENTAHLVTDKFSAAPFLNIKEGDKDLSVAEMKAIISQIPSDKYEAYPDTHNVPLAATLYKDGEVIEIAADDERLIRLTNFFNNSVYHSQCGYAQSYLSLEYLEEHVTSSDFRLELKYEPYGDEGPSPYGRCTTGCDAIMVANDDTMFALIAHHMPSYDWEEEKYPFLIAGFTPFFGYNYTWLELFGF